MKVIERERDIKEESSGEKETSRRNIMEKDVFVFSKEILEAKKTERWNIFFQ